jgi:hypothetical protein
MRVKKNMNNNCMGRDEVWLSYLNEPENNDGKNKRLTVNVDTIRMLRLKGHDEMAKRLVELHQASIREDFDLIRKRIEEKGCYERNVIRRREKIGMGLCAWCSKPRTDHGSSNYCVSCLEKKRDYNKRVREDKLEQKRLKVERLRR